MRRAETKREKMRGYRLAAAFELCVALTTQKKYDWLKLGASTTERQYVVNTRVNDVFGGSVKDIFHIACFGLAFFDFCRLSQVTSRNLSHPPRNRRGKAGSPHFFALRFRSPRPRFSHALVFLRFTLSGLLVVY